MTYTISFFLTGDMDVNVAGINTIDDFETMNYHELYRINLSGLIDADTYPLQSLQPMQQHQPLQSLQPMQQHQPLQCASAVDESDEEQRFEFVSAQMEEGDDERQADSDDVDPLKRAPKIKKISTEKIFSKYCYSSVAFKLFLIT